MIALDTNLLVYAHRAEMPLHDRARQVLNDLFAGRLAGREEVGIPWPCIHEFIGAVTHRRTWVMAHTMDQAFEAIGRMTASPQTRLIGEGPSHLATVRGLATASGIAGAQIHDARIAAICLSHGVRELWSCDRDFGRYPTLRVRNPLVG